MLLIVLLMELLTVLLMLLIVLLTVLLMVLLMLLMVTLMVPLMVLLTVPLSCVSRLMLGFMSGCAFLSMWVQNTSAVAMVMPIVEAVLQQILKANKDLRGEDNPGLQENGWFVLHLL